jgi:hypothetical protein
MARHCTNAAATTLTDLVFAFGENYKEPVPHAGNIEGRYYAAETRTEEITLPLSTKNRQTRAR